MPIILGSSSKWWCKHSNIWVKNNNKSIIL